MVDWKRKLTSRKFWMAIIGFVTPLLIAFGVSQESVAQIAGIIMSGATVIAYIIGEGLADSKTAIDLYSEASSSENFEDNTQF